MPTRSKVSDQRAYHHGDLRHALVEAALALVTEEQSWTFSLREVARRAGVSHNAPYNHFNEKRDLLAAVAARGFGLLRDRMAQATAHEPAGESAILALAQAYLAHALSNPALYRLMFGPEFGRDPTTSAAQAAEATRTSVRTAAQLAIRQGNFALDPDDDDALDLFTLSCWSMLHGVVMLLIDGRGQETKLPPDALVDALMRNLLHGLVAR
jgi:AcrR family transcriptional regulator